MHAEYPPFNETSTPMLTFHIPSPAAQSESNGTLNVREPVHRTNNSLPRHGGLLQFHQIDSCVRNDCATGRTRGGSS